MNVQAMTMNQIRQAGVAALVKALGPAGTVRFLQQFDLGKGDYAAGRLGMLGHPTVDELIGELKGLADKTADSRGGESPPHPVLYDKLREIASRGKKTTTYQPIAEMMGLDMGNPADRDRLSEMLGEISRFEHEHGRPLLSAVVVLQESGEPGAGFFTLARELGLQPPGEEDYLFYARELKKVFEQWRR